MNLSDERCRLRDDLPVSAARRAVLTSCSHGLTARVRPQVVLAKLINDWKRERMRPCDIHAVNMVGLAEVAEFYEGVGYGSFNALGERSNSRAWVSLWKIAQFEDSPFRCLRHGC